MDTNGDGSLSLSEIEQALGADTASGTDTSSGANSLSQAFNELDTNGDGQLSASEFGAGIDAFRAAHSRGGMEGAQGQSTVSA